jgi:hypothetical protein
VGIILQQRSFERAFSKLTTEQQATVRAAVAQIPAAFGRPHQHSGTGIRRFGEFYECRAGLQMRVLFMIDNRDFILLTVGDHDAIRAFVKNN